LENEFIRVEFDMATGGIRSLIDRKSGVELISSQAPAPAFEYTTEVSHGMTAWIIDLMARLNTVMKDTNEGQWSPQGEF